MANAAVNESCLKHRVRDQSNLVNDRDISSDKTLYQICVDEKETVKGSSFCLYEFGSGTENSQAQELVVPLVGDTGAGKSTLINSWINFILGVKWDDDFRFILIPKSDTKDIHSQTQHISVYRLHHQAGFTIPCTLTLVDTPGVKDTSGIRRDKEIFEQFEEFFNAEKPLVNYINAACFVVSSTTMRFDMDLQYVFHSVLSLFGKDMSDNIVILFTFCDASVPKSLATLREAKIPCEKRYKFNSSGVFPSNPDCEEEEEDDYRDLNAKLQYEVGENQFQKFVVRIRGLKKQSTDVTKEVLRFRREIEQENSDTCGQIQSRLEKLKELEEQLSIMKKADENVKRNKDFIKPVKVKEAVEVRRKENILAIAYRGFCVIIGKQPPKTHDTVTKEVTRLQTDKEIKAKYEKAKKTKLSIQDVISAITEDIESIEQAIDESFRKVGNNIKVLFDIALQKPDPDFMVRYLKYKMDQMNPFGMSVENEQYRDFQKYHRQAEMTKVAAEGSDQDQSFYEESPTQEQAKKIAKEKRDEDINILTSFLMPFIAEAQGAESAS